MDRRTFVKNLGLGAMAATTVTATATATATAALADGAAQPWEIVVVGGGFAGASAAKYIALWGGRDRVRVTLLDANPTHVSCILSNLVLNGQKTIKDLTFDLTKTATKLNNIFTFQQGKVSSIDRQAKQISGTGPNGDFTLDYDRLILAPGIEFDNVEGIDQTLPDKYTPFPHAWKAGGQTENLSAQLSKLPTGGKAKVVMTIPKSPYRCPPGPYERACVIADYLKNKKGGGTLYVFDANKTIQAEPTNFGNAFNGLYRNIIKYIPNREVEKVKLEGKNIIYPQFDKKTIIVSNNSDPSLPRNSWQQTTYGGCDLINVIPNQTAPKLLRDSGLIPSGNWAPVHLDSYRSNVDDFIYVIGDAHSSIQPKAGHIANSEAKICANALLKELGVIPNEPEAPPVTNSACFSPITATTASFLTAGFRYDPTTNTVVRVDESFGEAEQITSDNYKMMLAWANNLFAEVF